MGSGTVFKEENTLPGTQAQLSVINGDGKTAIV
jgi:hypothetical protein